LLSGPQPGAVAGIRKTDPTTIFQNPPRADGGFFIFPLLLTETQIETMNSEDKNNSLVHPVLALLAIYAATGMSAEHALSSALADYECYFEPVVQCAA
jgi:hypothetical protein